MNNYTHQIIKDGKPGQPGVVVDSSTDLKTAQRKLQYHRDKKDFFSYRIHSVPTHTLPGK